MVVVMVDYFLEEGVQVRRLLSGPLVTQRPAIRGPWDGLAAQTLEGAEIGGCRKRRCARYEQDVDQEMGRVGRRVVRRRKLDARGGDERFRRNAGNEAETDDGRSAFARSDEGRSKFEQAVERSLKPTRLLDCLCVVRPRCDGDARGRIRVGGTLAVAGAVIGIQAGWGNFWRTEPLPECRATYEP